MKLHLLAFVLLLAAVPAWAEEESAPATASPEPPLVETTTCSTLNAAPMTPAEVAADPFPGDPEMMTSALITVCIRCREFVTKCKNPGQDTGKPCGDGDPPNTCTCQRCDHTFGCFP